MKARLRWTRSGALPVQPAATRWCLGGPTGKGPEPGPSPMELVLMGTGGC